MKPPELNKIFQEARQLHSRRRQGMRGVRGPISAMLDFLIDIGWDMASATNLVMPDGDYIQLLHTAPLV